MLDPPKSYLHHACLKAGKGKAGLKNLPYAAAIIIRNGPAFLLTQNLLGMKSNYKGQAIEMAYVGLNVADSLGRYLPELGVLRSTWTPDYVDDLKARIRDIIRKRLSFDVSGEVRKMTDRIDELRVPAIDDLYYVSDQLSIDHDEAEKEEILNSLGYSRYLEKARGGDTESVVLMLHSFHSGMTDEMREKLLSGGVSEVLIDRIIGYAEEVERANEEQENLKNKKRRFSAETRQILNDLYDEIITICKIGARFYRHDPVKKDEFTYSKLLKRLRAERSSAPEEAEPTEE